MNKIVSSKFTVMKKESLSGSVISGRLYTSLVPTSTDKDAKLETKTGGPILRIELMSDDRKAYGGGFGCTTMLNE